jgi:glyoxylate reductase
MNKFRIFITRAIPENGINMLLPVADVEVWPGELPPSREVLLEKVQGVDAILSLLTDPIDAQVIQAAGPHLKVISQYAVGVDNIDVSYATAQHIPIGNTPGVLTDATADLTWALLMASARRVVEADRYTRAGQWKTWGPKILLGAEVAHATLGIIGFGRIGQAVARRARGFEMKILYTDSERHLDLEQFLGVEFSTLEQILSQSDFITLHTPLTPLTRGLIGETQFAQMKPTAILINTSRGPVVNQTDLFTALMKKRIAGAALDVTDPEPLPLDSPLLELDNLIIVPHIASAGIQTREKMAEMAAENLIAGLQGRPLPNCVNPQVYSRE